MRTLKFEGQHTNAFFHCCQSNVGRVFPAYDYCWALFCCLRTVYNDLITAHSAVVQSWEEPPNIWLTVVKNAFCRWALNFRVCMLLKGTVKCTINIMCLKIILQIMIWIHWFWNNCYQLYSGTALLPRLKSDGNLQW